MDTDAQLLRLCTILLRIKLPESFTCVLADGLRRPWASSFAVLLSSFASRPAEDMRGILFCHGGTHG